MPLIQKGIIAALAFLGVLLLVVFFVVYFSGEQTETVELTAPQDSFEGNAAPFFSASPAGNVTSAAGKEAGGKNEEEALRVYVAGGVHSPGVYPVRAGDRLVDAVEAAGGATEDADLEQVNLAIRVEDEAYYFIPYKLPEAPAGTAGKGPADSDAQNSIPALAADPATGEMPNENAGDVGEPGSPAGPVNLNTATQRQLESLPGIGPARSGAIIAYREQHGPFRTIDEITAVSGIGQGILNNLQDLITVGESP